MGLAEPVRSPGNPRLRAVRALRAGRDRTHVLLEGDRVLAEAIEAGAPLDWVLYDPAEHGAARVRLLEQAAVAGAELVPCERRLLDAVSDLSSPSGLLGWGPRPEVSARTVFEQAAAAGGLVLVSAGVQEPGNVGALVRVAAGLGAVGLVALHGGASPWHPRALRGASGTTFRIPVAARVAAHEAVRDAAAAGVELWAAETGGAAPESVARTGAVALVMGEEGGGVPAELRAACTQAVGIPLQRGVESLNVAAAAAVLVHALAAWRPE